MRTWTLALGMSLSLAGLAFAGQPDPATTVDGAIPAHAEYRSTSAGSHQETRADRQNHDGRQQTRGSSNNSRSDVRSRMRR